MPATCFVQLRCSRLDGQLRSSRQEDSCGAVRGVVWGASGPAKLILVSTITNPQEGPL